MTNIDFPDRALRSPKWLLTVGLTLGLFALVGWQAVPQGRTPSSLAACPSSGEDYGSSDRALTHVRYLADDALEGREVGTVGARCAADYIAERFRELGLEPAGDDGTYFQGFPIRAGAEPGHGNSLVGPQGTLTLGSEWTPYGFSGSAALSAPMVYGGDGINRPTEADNPYPHLDLTGKIVVLDYGDRDSPNRVPMRGTSHFKGTVAQGRDAAAVVVLMPEGHALPVMERESRAFLRIPVVAVSGRLAEALRASARAGESLELAASVEPRTVEARNVLALMPGSDPARMHSIVVIGAHYDHLGYGGEGSLDSETIGRIHNGADDNASGTAALIEVARELRQRKPRSSVLFVAFTGEEKGLWGSAHYVRNPTFPLSGTRAMLNMDMVGRLGGGSVTVFGVATADEWPALLDEANAALPTPMSFVTAPDGYGPSDHASFYGEDVPVLHFFTNTHEDYHRPSDDWEKIDEAGLEGVIDLVTEVAVRVAGDATNASTAITLARGAGNPHGGSVPTTPSSDSSDEPSSSGYGPYFGTIPDMVPIDFGVRISGVREGGPADVAGLRKGDVIVEFAGKEVADIYAYTYALREHEPGDEVEVVVLREGERVTLTAVLGRR